MIITDKRALSIFKRLECYEVKESIETYPEEERDGKTDLEIILNEIDYFIYMFEEVDGALSGDLEEARKILRKTSNGKTIPLDPRSLKPIYPEWRIKSAKHTVKEYKQLKRLALKLREEV